MSFYGDRRGGKLLGTWFLYERFLPGALAFGDELAARTPIPALR